MPFCCSKRAKRARKSPEPPELDHGEFWADPEGTGATMEAEGLAVAQRGPIAVS